MKKTKLITLLLILIGLNSFGQELSVTPNGLRDANDSEKTFVVINVEGKTAKQLFDNAIKYINKNYKNPEAVIKGKIEGEYLKYVTHVSDFLLINNSGAKILIDANYTTELSFKDGKIKYEIIELDMYAKTGGYKVLFAGGAFDGYPIYNKKGKLKREDTKAEIESYFNSQIKLISDALQGKDSNDNW